MQPQPVKRVKVYVVQRPMRRNGLSGVVEPTMDLSPAEEYGELVYLLPDFIPAGNLPAHVATIRNRMANFSKDDYLLLTGNPAYMGVATHYAADATGGIVSLLRWHRDNQKYQVLKLQL